ncbi:MAG: SPOR domain-containing protein, partial [Mangrovicoccus sp.]|nr:SPOR domain-containing protein [Mangrovicoccus sp.]
RDTRTVPVIRAMEGPARLAPADPGGFRAAHTGYSVNEIAAETPRIPVADEVAIAPAPTAVEQNDAPVMRPGAAPDREVMRNSVDRALFDALGLESGTAPSEPAPVQGIERRPEPRPTGLGEQVSRSAPNNSLPFAASTTSPVNAAPIEARDIPPNTRLAQLGAFATEAEARQEWTRLANGFGPYFAGKRPVYEENTASGQSVWRLRAHGFDDLAESRRFCEVLLAGQAECIPVLTR